jgi:aldehyde:ferredoxin oxidoreductase
MEIGERIYNLCRAFNIREGFSRRDDTLPARMTQPLPEGPYKGETLSEDVLKEMLDHYYKFRGWDKETGIPLKSTLEGLGLGWVAEELIYP